MSFRDSLQMALNSGGTKLVGVGKDGKEVDITVGAVIDAKLGNLTIVEKTTSAKDQISELFFGEKSKGSYKDYKELFELIQQAFKIAEVESVGTTKASFKELNAELFK